MPVFLLLKIRAYSIDSQEKRRMKEQGNEGRKEPVEESCIKGVLLTAGMLLSFPISTS